MKNRVDLIVEDRRWEAVGLQALAERACGAALAQCGVSGAEIAILACDDARIAALNGDFRGKAAATNVLSWPSEERGAEEAGGAPRAPVDLELGDIAISYDTCAREAEGRSFADHVVHLLVHGTLHLLGYDHVDDEDAALMEGLEIVILGKMGIANPYDEMGTTGPEDRKE